MRPTTKELSLGCEYGSYQDFAARMGLDAERCALAHAWDCGRIVAAGLFRQVDAGELEQGKDHGMAGEESDTGRRHAGAA